MARVLPLNTSKIIRFWSNVEPTKAFQTDEEIKELSKLEDLGGTALFRALDQSLNELEVSRRDRRQVLHIYTDGQDNESGSTSDIQKLKNKLVRFLNTHPHATVTLFGYYLHTPHDIQSGFDRSTDSTMSIDALQKKMR